MEAFVEEKLKLIYRRVDAPDIGIDGEIEMLSDDRTSTGGLLKVQVKTTEADLSGRRHRVPLDEKHLEYFDSPTVPPILVLASLASRRMWWKPMLLKENYRGSRGGFGVTFDLVEDQLIERSASVLRMIGGHSNAIVARYILEEVEHSLTDMDEGEGRDRVDLVVADYWGQTLRDVRRMMAEATCLLKYERRYTAEIADVEVRFVAVVDRISMRCRWFKENDLEGVLKGWMES